MTSQTETPSLKLVLVLAPMARWPQVHIAYHASAGVDRLRKLSMAPSIDCSSGGFILAPVFRDTAHRGTPIHMCRLDVFTASLRDIRHYKHHHSGLLWKKGAAEARVQVFLLGGEGGGPGSPHFCYSSCGCILCCVHSAI